MDTILIVNAGSSSVKFQVFAVGADNGPQRLIKGQVDGIGTRPRLRAEAADKKPLVDRSYAVEEIADVPAALQAGAAWLRRRRSSIRSRSVIASCMAARNTTRRS